MGTITKASYEALAAECAEWHKRAGAAEAALREIAKDSTPDPWGFARAALEIVAAPSNRQHRKPP